MPTPYERYVMGWKRAEAEMNRRKQLGFQERGVELGEQRFGLEEEKWPAQKALMEARTEELGQPTQPTTPFLDWRSRNPDAPIMDWYKLTQATQQPTAFARNLRLQEKNRMDFMRLSAKFGERKMFDERGLFLGSPQDRIDFNKYKLLSGEFGEKKDEGASALRDEYRKYYAAWQKLDLAEKQLRPLISWSEYQRQFEAGGEGGAPTTGYTQEQIDTYNACRAAGGDAAKCKAEAGITQ